MSLPLHGVEPTTLPAESPEATRALAAALRGGHADRPRALRDVATRWPTFLDAWARLAYEALAAGDPVAAYAFARTGYHRGLDRLRGSGWRGQGAVPWSHEPNRGFLRSLYALMRAAEAIGEGEEAERCAVFLREADPAALRALDAEAG